MYFQIAEKRWKTGNYLRNSYYKRGANSVGQLGSFNVSPRSNDQKDKHHNRYMLDRVRYQAAPVGPGGEEAVTFRYVYNEDRKKIHWSERAEPLPELIKGCTSVYDAYMHKKCFHYHADQRLTKVDHFIGSHPHYLRVLSEKYRWCEKGKLTAVESKDMHGNLVKAKRFNYDDRGNVLSEVLEGNLTGKDTWDVFERWYRYSGDGLNNLVADGES